MPTTFLDPFTAHAAPVSAVGVAPDDSVYSGSYDGFLGEWFRQGDSLIRRIYVHRKGVNCVAIDRCGRRLVTRSTDGICLVDRLTFDSRPVSHPGEVESAVFSPMEVPS